MFISFLITLLSGLATLIGGLIVFINIKDKIKIISFSMFFSSSVMLFISVFDLIPASFSFINKIYDFIPSIAVMAIYVLFGGMFVRYFDRKVDNNNSLYKIGIISMIALVIHNVPEGIITFISSTKNISLGISLSISIALHNIPEGIAVAIPIYYGENNKWKAFLFTFIAALSEPVGAIIGCLFVNSISDYLFAIILSLTSGIMIYLSIFEMFKEGKKYCNSNWIIYYIFGLMIVILTIYII